MSWFKFFFSSTFIKHISIITFSVLLILFLVMQVLKVFTNHNNTIILEDYSGVSIDSIASILEKQNLRYVIIDSIYNDKKEPGSIIEQDPKPGIHVKENRRVYFTSVAKKKKQVALPHLIDLTLRRAIVKLNSIGLEVGELTYIPDMAKNAVLEQKIGGKKVESGLVIPVGSKVDLVLGNGLSDVKVELPMLEGLTYEDAQLVLQMSSLNIGLAVFDSSVKDSTKAVVYRQRPVAENGKLINLGRNVDIFLMEPIIEEIK